MFRNIFSNNPANIDQVLLNSLNEVTIKKLKIKKSRCAYFLPNENADNCGCGLPRKDHDKRLIESYSKKISEIPVKWSPLTCTIEDLDTDAYGEIQFENQETTSKFIRVGQNTDMQKMIKLLFSIWNLEPPKLLISVTGGAQNFNLKSKLKDVFRRGLVKAALSTNAWITSGGNNVGVMKYVGEAISVSSLDPNKKLVVLGISNWCTATNRHLLIKKTDDENEILHYNNMAQKGYKSKSTPLDPNHSHFILVDNSELNVYGGEVEFRAKLEREIVNYVESKNAPIVVLVLEGGERTILTVLNSVKNGSPCVFIEGSGGCADFFAFALNKMNENGLQELNEDLRNELEYRSGVLWPTKSAYEIVRSLENVLQYSKLLSVFRLDSSKKRNEVDVAILRSLLKAQSDSSIAQLKLALTWNRIDIAKDFIFTEDKDWKNGVLNDLMYSALVGDKPDFVEIFLENDCDINEFLTYRRLLKLYNDLSKTCLLYKKLIKKKRLKHKINDNLALTFKFKEIGEIIEDMTDDLYSHSFTNEPLSLIDSQQAKEILAETDDFGNPKYIGNQTVSDPQSFHIDNKCKNPYHEIFMYSILTGKSEIAKIFWNYSNEITSALVASKIFKEYDNLVAGEDESYTELSEEYEKMAVDVIQSCYEEDQEDAQLMLLRQVPEYGNANAVLIGSSFENKNFVSSSCFQLLLAKLWHGQIFADASLINIIFAIILPFFAPLFLNLNFDKYKLNLEAMNIQAENAIKSDELGTSKENESNEEEKQSKLSYWEKIYYFFRSPFVKFCFNQLIEQEDLGVKIMDQQIGISLYEDDILILSDEVSKIQRAICIFEEFGKQNEIKFNPEKTQLITFGNKKWRTQKVKLYMHEKEIESIEKIKYLGVIVNSKNNNEDHIQQRIKNTMRSLNSIKTLGIDDERLKLKTKIQFYKTYCRPVLTYGCEALKMNNIHLRKMKTTEGTIIKRILRLNKKARTTKLMHALDVEPTETMLLKRKLAFIKRTSVNPFTGKLVDNLIKESIINKKSLSKKSVLNELNEKLGDSPDIEHLIRKVNDKIREVNENLKEERKDGYVILCNFYPIKHINEDGIEIGQNISWAEYLLIAWVLVFILDEIRQLIYIRLYREITTRKFFTDIWNIVELGSILLFTIGTVLRFFPNLNMYLAARIILSIDILFWFFRSLQGYSVIRSLGPKLVMIRRMLNELAVFILIVIVFIFAYGVATQALMYHNQELSLSLLKNVFFGAYFVIGGEYFEREKLMEVNECEGNSSELSITDMYTQDDCPEKYGTNVSLGLLVVYIIMLNILLVNLLIAIFSNAYEKVESEADKIWKFQRYRLVNEYFHRPFLPVPFTVLYYLFEIFRMIFRFIFGLCFNLQSRNRISLWSTLLLPSESNRLKLWESFIAEEYLNKKDILTKESQEYRLQINTEKVDTLNSKFEKMTDSQSNLANRMKNLEQKMDKILSLLGHNQDDDNVKNPVKQLTSRFSSADKVKPIEYYSDSNVEIVHVPYEKKEWTVRYDNYFPNQYTSIDVLYSLSADFDLLKKPENLRPKIKFNRFDNESGLDRTSCLGEYIVRNGIPLNPHGRQGISGRGSLYFWGPNQFYEIIFTRYKTNNRGEYSFDTNGKSVVEFLALDNKRSKLRFPSVLQEKNVTLEELIERNLIYELFSIEKMDHMSILTILKNPINITRYYKESKFNTDNAWFEFCVINYHDQADKIFPLLKLKDSFDGRKLSWKEINEVSLSNLSTQDSVNLKRVLKLHQIPIEKF
ncbi:unnamed protein product [Brachionus calyciflorus]|uniref:Uncharacterized protein n=1 Tax=Brachionus calyciflorus TaxID=104777 RepID=A0A814AS97_9BILA|nr:unnamed protein product [Brachionus calyciflorus]